jgi:assimilatory nitrate reductase catalytic subunit
LQYLWKNGCADQDFIAAHTQGLEQALAQSQSESSIEDVAHRTGISLEKLQTFYEKFAQTEKVMTLFSMGGESVLTRGE